jgi:hypothetical protein
MAFYDRMRTLDARLFAKFGVPATLTTKGVETRDRIKNSVTTTAPITIPVLAIPGKVEVKADDGTISFAAIVKVNAATKSGDRITIGTNTYTAGTVTPHAPDGGIPFHWIAFVS